MSSPANDLNIPEEKDSDTLSLLTADLIDKTSEDLEAEDEQGEETPIKKEKEPREDLETKDTDKVDLEVTEDKEDVFVLSTNRKEILAAYPDIFKKFPSLKRDIYQSREYREIFPTPEEARDAAQRAQTLEQAESALYAGDITEILKSVRSQDEQAFLRISDNFLPTVREIDNRVYGHIVSEIARDIIKAMIVEAKRRPEGDESAEIIGRAAAAVNQFMFGNTQYREPGAKMAKPLSAEDKKVQATRVQQIQTRVDEIHHELSERSDNALKAGITEVIDPKGLMTNYIKKNAISDCMNRLEMQIEQDGEFRAYQDRLWKACIQDNFSRTSQEKIKNAYINRAKQLLPDIIRAVRGEALSNKANARPKEEVLREREENSRVAAPRESRNRERKEETNNRRVVRSTRDFLDED